MPLLRPRGRLLARRLHLLDAAPAAAALPHHRPEGAVGAGAPPRAGGHARPREAPAERPAHPAPRRLEAALAALARPAAAGQGVGRRRRRRVFVTLTAAGRRRARPRHAPRRPPRRRPRRRRARRLRPRARRDRVPPRRPRRRRARRARAGGGGGAAAAAAAHRPRRRRRRRRAELLPKETWKGYLRWLERVRAVPRPVVAAGSSHTLALAWDADLRRGTVRSCGGCGAGLGASVALAPLPPMGGCPPAPRRV